MNPDAHAFPPGVAERLDALLAEGDREAIVETVFREIVMMTEEELAALRGQPAWQARVAVAHTITREIRAVPEARFDPEQAAKITVPTLLLTGSESRDPSTADNQTVAAALPDARITVLEGQEHVADVLVPEIFAEHVVAFLRPALKSPGTAPADPSRRGGGGVLRRPAGLVGRGRPKGNVGLLSVRGWLARRGFRPRSDTPRSLGLLGRSALGDSRCKTDDEGEQVRVFSCDGLSVKERFEHVEGGAISSIERRGNGLGDRTAGRKPFARGWIASAPATVRHSSLVARYSRRRRSVSSSGISGQVAQYSWPARR